MSCDARFLNPAADSNKYTRGKLTVVAGSARYPGAAVLAARAGQRMGAGYTEVVTHERAVDIVRLSSPSLVVRPFSEWDVRDLPAFRKSKPCAVCIGPGFVPGDPEGGDVLMRVLKGARCPVAVDGGALSMLGSDKGVARLSWRADEGLATVVTPHGGEAARLAAALQLEQGEPGSLAASLALRLRAVVVLKGPDTYVSDGLCTVAMTEGTPALAKAGTGDVLAGMIGSLLAQGESPFEAALLGCTLHARAGIAAAGRLTEVCVCPEDVIESLPDAVRTLVP